MHCRHKPDIRLLVGLPRHREYMDRDSGVTHTAAYIRTHRHLCDAKGTTGARGTHRIHSWSRRATGDLGTLKYAKALLLPKG